MADQNFDGSTDELATQDLDQFGFQARRAIQLFAPDPSLRDKIRDDYVNCLAISYLHRSLLAVIDKKLCIVPISELSEALEGENNGKANDDPLKLSQTTTIDLELSTQQIYITPDEKNLTLISKGSLSMYIVPLKSVLATHEWTGSMSQLPHFDFSSKVADISFGIQENAAIVLETNELWIINLQNASGAKQLRKDVTAVYWQSPDRLYIGTTTTCTDILVINASGQSQFTVKWDGRDDMVFVPLRISEIKSNTLLVTYGQDRSASDSSAEFRSFLIEDNKIGKEVMDICQPWGDTERKAKFYGVLLKKWSPTFSPIFITIGTQSSDFDALNSKCIMVELNDYDAAHMPLDSNSNDETPLGLVLDLQDSVDIKQPCKLLDNSGPLPRIITLSSEGQLLSWNVWCSDDIKNNKDDLAGEFKEKINEIKAANSTTDKVKPEQAVSKPQKEEKHIFKQSIFNSKTTANPFGASTGNAFGKDKPVFGQNNVSSATKPVNKGFAVPTGPGAFGNVKPTTTSTNTKQDASPFGTVKFGRSGFGTSNQSKFGSFASNEQPKFGSFASKEQPKFGSFSFNSTKEKPAGSNSSSNLDKKSPFAMLASNSSSNNQAFNGFLKGAQNADKQSPFAQLAQKSNTASKFSFVAPNKDQQKSVFDRKNMDSDVEDESEDDLVSDEEEDEDEEEFNQSSKQFAPLKSQANEADDLGGLTNKIDNGLDINTEEESKTRSENLATRIPPPDGADTQSSGSNQPNFAIPQGPKRAENGSSTEPAEKIEALPEGPAKATKTSIPKGPAKNQNNEIDKQTISKLEISEPESAKKPATENETSKCSAPKPAHSKESVKVFESPTAANGLESSRYADESEHEEDEWTKVDKREVKKSMAKEQKGEDVKKVQKGENVTAAQKEEKIIDKNVPVKLSEDIELKSKPDDKITKAEKTNGTDQIKTKDEVKSINKDKKPETNIKKVDEPADEPKNIGETKTSEETPNPVPETKSNEKDGKEEGSIEIKSLKVETERLIDTSVSTDANVSPEACSVESPHYMDELIAVGPQESHNFNVESFENEEVYLSTTEIPPLVPALLSVGKVEYPSQGSSEVENEMLKICYDINSDITFIDRNIKNMNVFLSRHSQGISHTIENSLSYPNFWRLNEGETISREIDNVSDFYSQTLADISNQEKTLSEISHCISSMFRGLPQIKDALSSKKVQLKSTGGLPFDMILSCKKINNLMDNIKSKDSDLQSRMLFLNSIVYPEALISDPQKMNLIISNIDSSIRDYAKELIEIQKELKGDNNNTAIHSGSLPSSKPEPGNGNVSPSLLTTILAKRALAKVLKRRNTNPRVIQL